MKILLIDNYDSFTENVAQYLYEVTGSRVTILPNTVPFEALKLDRYDAIVLSPGPGHPGKIQDFGVCTSVIAKADVPILGICLGHQGIVHALGGLVDLAPEPVHGYRSQIHHTEQGLFEGIPQNFEVVRYHSLACTELPQSLRCTAWTNDGVVMAIEHVVKPMWGVQFHPESTYSEFGHALLSNFLRMARQHNQHARAPRASTTVSSSGREAYLSVGGKSFFDLAIRELPHVASPAVIFQEMFANDEYAYWLDSEETERPNARYSLMGSGSVDGAIRLTYDVKSSELQLAGAEAQIAVKGDFFGLVGEILDSVHVYSHNAVPSIMKGGFVGYLGYELKSLSGGAMRHRSSRPDAFLMLATHYFVFDHEEEKLYECLLSETGRSQEWPALHPSLMFDNPAAVEGGQFVPGAVAEDALTLEDVPSDYLEKIRRAKQYIEAGESYEICLTNRAKVDYAGAAIDAYFRMRRASPVPYGAFLSCGQFSVLSASPETFLAINESGSITSRLIKGTRPRGQTLAEDATLQRELEASTKDRAENLMIVDLVRHDLNRVCRPGSVKVPELFRVESYSSVHQLVSTVTGQLREGTSTMEAIRACFPGGSMTGAPKKRTMDIIDVLESTARGVYSGALGWISFAGAAELSIVIRTAVLADGQAEFGIGGAIVAQSIPEEELAETLVKASVPYFAFKSVSRDE